MKLIRCEKGHYYDGDRHANCPYCEDEGRIEPQSGAVMPQPQPEQQDEVRSMLQYVTDPANVEPAPAQSAPETAPAQPKAEDAPASPQEPKPYAWDVRLPAAYLYCTHGPSKGQDYKLFPGQNFLGRSERMDVVIKGDIGISRENNAIIVCDELSGTFFLTPGREKATVYVHESAVQTTVMLKARERIEIGDTVLAFLPVQK